MKNQKILKYRKRHWQKFIGNVYSIKILGNAIQVVVYKKNSKIMTLCLNPDLFSLLKELRVNTKVTMWFSTKSVYQKTGDKWTTTLYLMHIEKTLVKKQDFNVTNNQYNINQDWNRPSKT
tara:strand:- start:1733 stop:2092 length:360 start_codon:yes stop_codon:yes gene_type:complete